MTHINLNSLNQFNINSYEEARAAIRDLELEVLILGKKIRKVFIDAWYNLPSKIEKHMKRIGNMLEDAFRIDSWEDYTQATAIYGEELSGALYNLQGSFAGLKVAVIQAAAPVVQVLLPVVQVAVRALTGLAQSIGYVLRMLFLGTAEVQEYSYSLQGAAGASKALKKSLAGFDQINRLNDNTGGGFGGALGDVTLQPISGGWKKLADKILELMEPLKKIDLKPAAESLERLRKALEPITKALFEGLEWAWYNIFVPLAQWTVEELLPVFLDTLTAALETLGRIIEELKPHFIWLWENCLKPWAEWKADQLIGQLQGVQDELRGVSGWINVVQNPVDTFISSVLTMIDTMGTMAQKSMGLTGTTNGLSLAFGGLLSYFLSIGSPLQGTTTAMGALIQTVSSLAGAFTEVTESSDGTWESMKQLWNNAWGEMKGKLLDPSYQGVKDTMNGTIGLLNGLLGGATSGVNFVTKALNKLSFTIPDWVPIVGGKSFGFYAKPLQAPSIPYLAKGAVLPANKPFMAVVGDQKHGTNIEAPLTTIQEAVSLVMEDYAASNLAGHQATVSVLQELLAAVLGISIGDDTLAAAVDRYNGKLSVVRGGYL